MKVGLFDHLERSDRPLATEYDERLRFAVAAEEAGFYCLHVAEHHGTPLNMVPVPGVYLGAVARLTSRMRLGPMVYLLPLYSPLRLIEEICMLDHLSRGRLDIGVGRGVSPFELNFHKVAHEQSRNIFVDAFDCILSGLTSEALTHAGPHFTYTNVPMALRPLQAPHPPFWYGSSNAIGAAWAGERGLHFAANGPTALAKENIAAFRTALAKGAGPAVPKPEFPGDIAIGLLRHIVVADTDAEARRIAKPNIAYHAASLNYLRKTQPATLVESRTNVHRGRTFEEWEADGMAIAGSPATVLAALGHQAAELGINYLVAYLFFGTMTLEEALRSLDLFRAEVMPRLAQT
jgi:alkanesulfonate monooxygenase SsuD/methylene tetrahydromethanopterin reductase-like flavin-dependent oxidoreductase (luciferase family)